MFKVGDKVVCPMRGCGIVETIEEREIFDGVQEYTVIKILNSTMTITLPTTRLADSRFRLISNDATSDHILHILAQPMPTTDALSSKDRIKSNTAKITAGSLQEYAEVVRDLTTIQKEKPLNSGERSMLLNARKFLVAELGLIKNISEDQVNALVDKQLT